MVEIPEHLAADILPSQSRLKYVCRCKAFIWISSGQLGRTDPAEVDHANWARLAVLLIARHSRVPTMASASARAAALSELIELQQQAFGGGVPSEQMLLYQESQEL